RCSRFDERWSTGERLQQRRRVGKVFELCVYREAQRQADEVSTKSRGDTVRVDDGVQFHVKGPGFPWRLWVFSWLHSDDCRRFPGCTVFVSGPSRRQQKRCRRRGLTPGGESPSLL
ncbi:hypothetical protein Dimus_032066, partial [Dionaea muscipula]